MAEKKSFKNRFMKSTVRNRKQSKLANTQRYLPFAEIRNDTVILKNGGLRAVLEVEPINFNLKSETEQQGIIAGYEAFINTLVFPLQIVMRSSKVNIDPYLQKIHNQAARHESPLMKEQTLAYATFVEKIVEIADIMQKRFYIVIPLDDTPYKPNAWNRFKKWMNVDDSLSKASARNKKLSNQLVRLKERIDLVETGLRNIGVTPRRLNTIELIRLYYEQYNREQSKNQKLPDELEFNTARNVL